MNSLETIDRLCAVVREQAEIIHAQALFIEEQQTVDAALKQEFAAQRDKVDAEISLIEVSGYPIRDAELRKGD